MEILLIPNIIAFVFLWNFLMGFARTKGNLFCGLIGYSGKLDFDQFRIKLIFAYNQTRGRDSCGFYVGGRRVNKLEDRVFREVGAVMDVMLPQYTISDENLLIGHTRAKTHGQVSLDHAHPFQYASNDGIPIIGAHNGVVSNHYSLAQEIGDNCITLPVDSMVIFKSMRNLSTMEQYCGFLKKLGSGSNAIMFSRDDGKLWVFRMEDRPLFRGVVKTSKNTVKGMYLSSLKESLEAAECADITAFDVNTLYCIEDGAIVDEAKVVFDLPKPITTVTTYRNLERTTRNVNIDGSDDDVTITFTKSVIFGDITSEKGIVDEICKQGKILKIHRPTLPYIIDENDTDDYSPILSKITSQTKLTEEEETEMLAEFREEVGEFLSSLSKRIASSRNDLASAVKAGDDSGLSDVIKESDSINEDIANMQAYVQTGQKQYFEKINAA